MKTQSARTLLEKFTTFRRDVNCYFTLLARLKMYPQTTRGEDNGNLGAKPEMPQIAPKHE